MPLHQSSSKVGVYVDAANIYYNGGQRMQYDVLREFACRDHGEPVRLNVYVTYDADRGQRDEGYHKGTTSFHSVLRDFGYKVIVKKIKWYHDESGNRYGKANADLDLAVDALLQSESLDRVLIASGDGDFVRVIQALQNKGCRVEVVALDNVSSQLRQEADMFLSGYLIPNLIPITNKAKEQPPAWGQIGSRVRGWCYWHNEQGYGFMRYLKKIAPGLWLTDARHPDSPHETAYFHDSNLPTGIRPSILPSRNYLFEFELAQSDRGDRAKAVEIALAGKL